MISKDDLLSAIAECQGERNPNANTCYKLAAYYALKDRLYPDAVTPGNNAEQRDYSFDAFSEPTDIIDFDSGSEFSEAINGKKQEDVLPVIDELLAILREINRPLYRAVLRKLKKD